MNAETVKQALAHHANKDDAVFLQRFFMTGPGQYGEGDVFIGVRVPQTRAVCKQYSALPLSEVQKLLTSKVHEYRLAALIIMTYEYPNVGAAKKQAIYELYMKNLYEGNINNWDLVDVSAEYIVGPYLQDKSKDVLYKLARSENIWRRRVAILSTFAYIKQGNPSTTFELAKILLHDSQDLLQKAVGWMLREVGKRVDEKILTDFLRTYAHEMPRTMLRYSIERLSPEQRAYFMKMK